MKERFKCIPAVYLLLEKDDKILLSRRYQTGYEDGMYGLVSGHVDGNETMTQAMIREAFEEIGIQINPEDLGVVHVLHRKKATDERIEFFFTVKQWEGDIINKEPEKCDDLSWCSYTDLPEHLIPYLKFVIKQWRAGEHYSEYGWIDGQDR